MKEQEILDMNHKTEQLTATESQKITVLENGNLMTVSDKGLYMGLFENKDCGDVWLTFDITEVIKPQYIRSLADIKHMRRLEEALIKLLATTNNVYLSISELSHAEDEAHEALKLGIKQ
jgi:hypothetical protein